MNKIWTYIISKNLSESALNELTNDGKAFILDWTAHENQLSADFKILKDRIIIVKVNEDVNNASGCSIDKLTRFIKSSEVKFGIELLNRFIVAYKMDDEIAVVHASTIKDLLAQKKINKDTLVYNSAISREDELQNWEQALKNTWLNKYLAEV